MLARLKEHGLSPSRPAATATAPDASAAPRTIGRRGGRPAAAGRAMGRQRGRRLSLRQRAGPGGTRPRCRAGRLLVSAPCRCSPGGRRRSARTVSIPRALWPTRRSPSTSSASARALRRRLAATGAGACSRGRYTVGAVVLGRRLFQPGLADRSRPRRGGLGAQPMVGGARSRRSATVPVHAIPMPVAPGADGAFGPGPSWGCPRPSSCFNARLDHRAGFERQNPLAVVEAFRRSVRGRRRRRPRHRLPRCRRRRRRPRASGPGRRRPSRHRVARPRMPRRRCGDRDLPVRQLRVAAPGHGLRAGPGRGNVARQAGDRYRVLRQPRVHGRWERAPGRSSLVVVGDGT